MKRLQRIAHTHVLPETANRMDIWSDEGLDRLEQRVDYALLTEDDGRAMIVSPATIKDLIAAFRHLRANGAAGSPPESPGRDSGS